MNRSDRERQEPSVHRVEGDDRNRTGGAFRSSPALPPDAENPYPPGAPFAAHHDIWNAGFAAGRAAATPDQPKTGATSREQREAAIKKATAMVDADTTGLLRPAVAPAASPDERLREALREIVRQVEEYPALSPTGIMVRDDIAGMVEGTATAALAAADREAPDGPRCNCVQYIEGDVTYHASGCPRAPVSDDQEKKP